MSVRKAELRHYIGSLSKAKLRELNSALKEALDIG